MMSMEIHNLMEDKVLEMIAEICDSEAETKANGYCTSEQCRLDAACFVLNRIPQRYVTSGRGFAYLESDFNENQQLQVDIVTLCHDGLRRVSTIQRSFYEGDQTIHQTSKPGPHFTFPLIKGRLFNGITFEPIVGLEIKIRFNKELVPMIDSRWPNPYSVVGNTPGTYLFWPRPVEAEYEGEEKEFELVIESSAYEPFFHYFTLPIRAEDLSAKSALKPNRDFNLTDLFLIPRGIEEDMQF
jgi:competence protein ComFB